jgi:circadian clock protein KaiB
MTASRVAGEDDARIVVRLRLYVAGDSPNSVTALANVRRVLRAHTEHEVTLEVIDVVRDPLRGVRDGVLITPMLVRAEPPPERRVLGSLRDRGLLLGILDVDGKPHE